MFGFPTFGVFAKVLLIGSNLDTGGWHSAPILSLGEEFHLQARCGRRLAA